MHILKNQEDTKLADELVAILDKHAIAEEFALKKYKELKLAKIDMGEQERYAYSMARMEFNALLTELAKAQTPNEKEAYELGKTLLELVAENKTKSIENNKNFDYKYHTNLVKTAADLILSPNDVDKQNAFKDLIDHTEDGKPSLTKRARGVATMFMATVIIIGSVIGSFFLSPFMHIGTGFGGVCFLAGLASVINSRSKGLHKTMTNYLEAAKHSTFFLNKPSAPPPDVEQNVEVKDQSSEKTNYPALYSLRNLA